MPTEEHVAAVERLAAEGVHVLVEKPLAATGDEAREIIAAVERAGVRGAVGHVERYNPALLAARDAARRSSASSSSIATERIGPFPDRISDVGVVKDLATHDLDLVRWLGGAPVEIVAAQTSHRMGREHEDLVLATGRLASDVPFHCRVDWLTPTKTPPHADPRRARDARRRHAHRRPHAATRTPTCRSSGTPTQQLRGVSRGRRDPLRAAAPRAAASSSTRRSARYVAGDDDAPVVTLEAGLETVADRRGRARERAHAARP